MIFDLSPDNPSCSDFSAYAEWLLQGGLSAQTVRNHFGAIIALYIWVGNQKAVDILNSPPWMINTVRPNRSVRSAMTPDDLIAMIHASTSSDYFTPLLVALTFGFFGYLRISNLAPLKASTFDPTTFGYHRARAGFSFLHEMVEKTSVDPQLSDDPAPAFGLLPTVSGSGLEDLQANAGLCQDQHRCQHACPAHLPRHSRQAHLHHHVKGHVSENHRCGSSS